MKKTLIVVALILGYLVTVQSQAKFGKLLELSYPHIDNSSDQVIIIYFKDKESSSKLRAVSSRNLLSERAISRRLKVRSPESLIDEADLPLNQSYVQNVSNRVIAIRHQLKWFNAVSAVANKSQIDELRTLPFVKEIDLVGRWKVDRSKEGLVNEKSSPLPRLAAGITSLNYGGSYTQLHQINVPAVHDLGYHGEGIVIGVFDNGVRLPSHHAFDSMQIIATYDFVDHKVSVVPLNTSSSFGSHGVNTLSLIGGNDPGHIIGPAFKAKFILARTENDSSETPIEEDNWAAAIQWADSIGVDVTSTSLGYSTFDSPYTSLTWQDMDGVTALITRAGDRADSLGIVVVNAAGNEGHDASHNTLIAPADGFNIITVAAVDSFGAVAGFSSNGPTADGRIKPDIAALGVSDLVADGVNISQYDRGSGTSYATPLSAGVAALVLCANPTFTPAQVRAALKNTASKRTSPDNYYGWGILNALAAVHYFDTTLAGTVFTDQNGNGSKDAGEAGIGGITVRLSGAKVDSTLTDEQGKFFFDSLAFGSYTVTIDYSGAELFSPVGGHYTAVIDSLNRRIDSLNFASFVTGAIRGSIFNDSNMNGVRDISDSALVNWTVLLSGPASRTASTDSNGNFSFTGLGPGTYTVRESLLTAWMKTAPVSGNSFSVAIVSGLDTTVPAFGNARIQANEFLMNKGWNLISLSEKVANSLKDSIYPLSVSQAFIYKAGYQPVANISNGIGFWLKFDSSMMTAINGQQLSVDTVTVSTGWNMIGSISFPVAVAGIIQVPSNLIDGSFYGYNNGYSAAVTLVPGTGYWVKATGPGMLILQPTSVVQKKSLEPQAK
jgi:hypothetical protein